MAFVFTTVLKKICKKIYKVHRILLLRKKVNQTRLVENDSWKFWTYSNRKHQVEKKYLRSFSSEILVFFVVVYLGTEVTLMHKKPKWVLLKLCITIGTCFYLQINVYLVSRTSIRIVLLLNSYLIKEERFLPLEYDVSKLCRKTNLT